MPGGKSVSWSDQVEAMTQVWTEAQKKIWENWYDLARTAPTAPFHPDWADQWQKLAAQGLEAWTANTEPTAKEVAERLLASQKTFMRFLEFLTNTWKTMAARVEAGEDWHNVLKAYTDQWRQQLAPSPEQVRQINQDMGELWRLYLEEWNKLLQPWVKSSQLARGHWGQAVTGNGSALTELTNLYWDVYERTFGRLLESPSLGYTRELNEKLLKGFDVWQDFRQASFEYQVILADTWVQALDRLMKELMLLAEQGQPVQSVRQLALLWNNIADPVFIEVFRSEKYIRSQGRLLNAAMAYRLHQREISELFLKISDMPTRTEVDEAHRHIYEQRKEIKALKRTLAEISPTAQNELAEARRSIEVLQQEVKALKEALAAVTARQTPVAPETSPPAKTRPAPKTSSKNKRGIADNNEKEGGEHVTVSAANPA